ncbi:MAG: hypothetical protein QM763_15330 [Agriterribacter sp.]
MKLIASITLFALASFISCTKADKSLVESPTSSIENIQDDSVFQEELLYIQKQYANIQDFQALKDYLKNGQLSESEEKNIHKIFGYETRDQFLTDLTRQRDRIIFLNKKYNLPNVEYNKKILAIEKSFDNLGVFSVKSDAKLAARAIDPCESYVEIVLLPWQPRLLLCMLDVQ